MSDQANNPTQDERNMALVIHLLSFFTGFVGPLVLWLVKKDTSEYLDQHGKDALNYQISLFLYTVGLTLITLVTFGYGAILFIPFALFAITGFVLAAMQGYKGEPCKYPLTIRLLN